MALDDEVIDLPIVISVVDGEIVGVTFNGVEARALVVQYPVQFPCIASEVHVDADGEYYTATVI